MIAILIIVAIVIYCIYRHKVDSGEIVVSRKAKKDFPYECKRYYEKCDELLLPLYKKSKTLYELTLEEIENDLWRYYSYYEYCKGIGFEDIEDKVYFEYVKALFESNISDKHIGWALRNISRKISRKNQIAYRYGDSEMIRSYWRRLENEYEIWLESHKDAIIFNKSYEIRED